MGNNVNLISGIGNIIINKKIEGGLFMPQVTQIVPNFQHPNVSVVINDNSAYTDEVVAAIDSNVKFLCVFRSGMGIDNKIVKKTDLTDFTSTFGNLNYSLYGQPLMMPHAILSSGYGSVYAMRVLPADATYANAVLSAMYKADAAGETAKFHVKYVIDYVTGGKTKSDIATAVAALNVSAPDTDGYKKLPIAVVRTTGRGEYGNKFRFRISRNTNYEKDYEIKMYNFDVISTFNGASTLATYTGGVITSDKYDQTTLITDVVDAYDDGSTYFKIDVDEANVTTLYNDYVTFLKTLTGFAEEIPSIDEWDLFFGYTLNSTTKYSKFEIVTTGDDDIVAVDTVTGISLANGTEGAFTSGTAEQQASAIATAYTDAFEGSLDRTILSPKRVPYDVLLDANYPDDVKSAMYALNVARNDAILHLDAGTETTLSQVSTVITDMSVFTKNCSKEWQHYLIRDPQSKKKVAVTTTYFMAQKLAYHLKTYGNHVPFVMNYATITGHVKNSLEPSVETTDTDVKELLYNARINYYETSGEDTFRRACQNTAQTKTSDLLEENNLRTLLELKRGIEDDCLAKLYNFADSEARKTFTNYERAKYASWVGTKVASLDIYFDMNEFEAQRSILHCYASVQFRTLNKRTIIEIDINKRDVTA